MEAKIHKDVVLFKRILTHDKFGDHVEEVRRNLQAPRRFIFPILFVSLVSKLERRRARAA